MFSSAQYIKANACSPADSTQCNPAPRFRKSFLLSQLPRKATLHCAGLGIGYFYINGSKASQDLFTAPVSDYLKTVWYCSYDVTPLLQQGENVIAAIIGNGYYNESFASTFHFDRAPWRDNPKLIAKLEIEFSDGTNMTISSDGSWKVSEETPYLFNALRSGETYDARLFQPGWNTTSFDDRMWNYAVVDTNPPSGVLRPCLCEPIREFDVYEPQKILEIGDAYIFCFPQNISGYVRLDTSSLLPGQRISIRYAEVLDENGNLTYLNSRHEDFYPGVKYAYTEFIANGDAFTWSPRFSYFGFRYVEVTGLKQAPDKSFLKAVFVHQALQRTADFSCSDARLTRLYTMGIYATFSNLFYIPTDCPTREKLGWANDAQASTEQFLINFASDNFLKKWFQDILDSMREDGAIPGIIPTNGWGFEWGAGPVSTGILYEIPWRLYEYRGDDSLLRQNTGAFIKHLKFMASMADSRGFPDYGLCDWAGPWERMDGSPVPRTLTNTLLYIKFIRLTRFAMHLTGEDDTFLCHEEQRITKQFLSEFFDEKGKLRVPFQCSASMCLVLDVCPDPEVLAEQLVEVIERDTYHINCGMLGLQYIYDALEKIGREDLAYKLVTAEGYPSYFSWIDQRDATTLCENWTYINSQNHHMFSNVLAWMARTLAGIRPAKPGFRECIIKPYFTPELSFCDAYQDTVLGRISVKWSRVEEKIHVHILVPKGVSAKLVTDSGEFMLHTGNNQIVLSL